ncbi:MAG: GGDEF domain-containing protein [Gaiellaceae bacterium]|jgi:diguanylate cyclase (GGDEF)-like protein
MAAWIAVAAGISAVVLALTVLLLLRRQRALESGSRGPRRDRPELAGSLDLDDVVARVLDEALALEGVDAAVLSLEGDEKGALVKSAGMSQQEAEQQAALGSQLTVPLAGELGSLGSLTVISGTGHDLAATVDADVAEIVRRGVPALDNAFRYREARRLADTDALTGLRNRRFFHETLQRECTRAHRYGRSLALLVLDVDDFKAINERVGHLSGDGVLAETAFRLRAALRASDIACRVGGDEFAIVLPEAGARQAGQLYERIERAVSSAAIGSIERLTLSGGVAQLADGEVAAAFFERADDALYRAKQRGKAQLFSVDG